MNRYLLASLVGAAVVAAPRPEFRIPAFTAYIAPDPEGADVSPEHGVSGWRQPGTVW
jgi:hypothetical protein